MRYLLVSDFNSTKEFCLDEFKSVSDKDINDLIDFIESNIQTEPESTIRMEEKEKMND